VKYKTVNIPTLDETLKVCWLRAVLPSNWEKFNHPQEELQGGPATSCDTSYVPRGYQEKHLTQQRELNDLESLNDFESLKSSIRCSGIMTAAEELAGYKIRCTYSRNFLDITECRILFVSAVYRN
jgi:hypothetical protein